MNEDALKLIRDKYKIGTSKKWLGVAIFWNIDTDHRVRTGKLIK